METYRNKAFTLVEILIVVVILGILAAIVIPQFSQASEEARLSSLCSDLQTVRSQIELYKIQHKDVVPGLLAGAIDQATFISQMTGQTDINGAAGTDYGPYLQKVPTNPFTDGDGINGAAPDGDPQGWTMTVAGAFNASDATHSSY